ncbi:MAG: desulfoferrodoxin family protein, partial [Nanoarchaeota archaeon]
VGKEVEHPNEPAHSVKFIDIYFKPEKGEVIHLARVDFGAHGEFGIHVDPKVILKAKLSKGKIVALAYCNLHGVWKAEKEIE